MPEPHPIGVDDGSCTDLIFITEHLRAWRPWQTITTATVPDTTTAAIGTTDVRVAVTPDAVAGLITTISIVAMRAPDAAVTAIAVTMASVATTEADLRGAPGMMIVAAMSSIMAMATARTGIARDTAATGTTTGAVDVTVAGSAAETTAGEIDRTIATRAVPGTIDAAGAAGRTGVTAPVGVTTGTVSIRTVNTGATVTGRIVGIAPKVAAAGTVPIETNTVTLTDSAETGAMIDRALGDAGTTGVVATVAGMVVTRATGSMTSVMIGVPARTAAAGRTSATAAAMTAVVRRVVTTTGLTVVTVAMIAATAVAAVTIPGRRVARVLTSCSCRKRSRHATSP